MAECTTTSAPSDSGCCRYGVANVLSTHTSAPRLWAISQIFSMSKQRSNGLVGVSSHTSLVSSGHSATRRSVSIRSTAVHVSAVCTLAISRNVPP